MYYENKTPLTDKPTSDAGFTLIEVLVAMTIIAIMVVGVTVTIFNEPGKAKIIRAKADIAAIEQALELYRLDLFDYPEQEAGLEALRSAPSGIDTARYNPSGYLKKLPADPWGNPYVYNFPGDFGVYDVISYGSDGELGGEGQAADVTSADQ